MPALVTPAQVREHVETDLLDPALQRLIDDADLEIVKRYGAHAGPLIEVVDGNSGLISTTRPILAVTSIVERIGTMDTVLAANDWQLWYGRVLERLTSGTNAASEWGDRITITYTPADENAVRTRVELDLVKLAIRYDGHQAATSGDFSETLPDYQESRDAILADLQPALGVA